MDTDLLITASLCRAARGLLGWSAQELASRAGLPYITIAKFEADPAPSRRLQRAKNEAVLKAFAAAGVEVFGSEGGAGAGVRYKHRE